jgi:hypothetical protein
MSILFILSCLENFRSDATLSLLFGMFDDVNFERKVNLRVDYLLNDLN